ncbi:MAG: DUF4982 domain-containing protein [Clostridia bacterium]|nr:DUF4982 domain-containing protein [Clostridia bacterium]
MSERILFVDKWLFHDGEIETERPAVKGPVYTEAKTETYRRGPASINYDDKPNDFGGRPGHMITHERWDTVKLPHDYIVNSPITESGNNALGFYEYHPAWYRKHFKANDEWRGKRVELEFLGVSTECDIYLNGVYMTRSMTAYTPIVVDISDFIKFDGADNVIAVHVTCETIENWWYNGAGITHKVYLNVSEQLSVARDGVFLAPKRLDGDTWEIPTSVEIRNGNYTACAATVTTEILSESDEVIASASGELSAPARCNAEIKYSMTCESPQLWDIDSPKLYRARTRVYCGGELADERYDKFGFRTIEFYPESGFFLNGRSLKLNGICGHEDFGLTGKAVPDNVMRYKVRMIKSMGVNAYRCAHSMQDEAMMDAFDEYGMLVMAETRHFSSTPAHMAELAALVRRDRNRPSVIMWSVGNEEHYFITDEGRRIAQNMIFEVKRLDGTRPVMTANDKAPEQCTVYDCSDLVAVNYNPHLYDYLHEKFPNKPFFVSECSAASGTRGWYYGDSPSRGYREMYDRDTNNWFQSHENVFTHFKERPWIFGWFVWSAFEYLGEAVWPRLCSCSGAIDLYLQPKDSYYQLKTYYSAEPTVHILPHWNMEEGDVVKVFVYDNCDSVELFLNGKSLGREKTEKYVHHEWHVPFEAGKLTCVGYDADGKAIAECCRETTGKPVSLALRLENGDDLSANGEDLALVTCYMVDSEGREVPDAEGMISFITDRGVTVVGTGSDNTDHTPPACPDRRMRAGRVLCAILPERPGKTTLIAKCYGLRSAKLEIDVKPDKNPVPGRVYPKYEIRG